MDILQRGVTPDGTKIQIEDWKENYPNSYKTLTIGCYPIARQDSRLLIKKGKTFRCSIEVFKNDEECKEFFNKLAAGSETIDGMIDRIRNQKYKYYLGYLEEEPLI